MTDRYTVYEVSETREIIPSPDSRYDRYFDNRFPRFAEIQTRPEAFGYTFCVYISPDHINHPSAKGYPSASKGAARVAIPSDMHVGEGVAADTSKWILIQEATGSDTWYSERGEK